MAQGASRLDDVRNGVEVSAVKEELLSRGSGNEVVWGWRKRQQRRKEEGERRRGMVRKGGSSAGGQQCMACERLAPRDNMQSAAAPLPERAAAWSIASATSTLLST